MPILRIAVNSPMRRLFDYLPPEHCPSGHHLLGHRLRVPFGKKNARVGIVVAISKQTDVPQHKLKKALAQLDDTPLFPPEHLQWLQWVSDYYHHPIGDVVFGAIPSRLRQGKPATLTTPPPGSPTHDRGVSLWAPNTAQKLAVDTIAANPATYQTFLLHGITGSGKTEVYLHTMRALLDLGKQVLVLVPEIGLTPQFVEHIKKSFIEMVAVIHSGLSDGENLRSWLSARHGDAAIILGTRSAIWTPIKNLGVIIVDEEHDLSYKQQEGLRYSARDLAIIRGQRANVPVVLGSATPSMESMLNADNGRYQLLQLTHRINHAKLPAIQINDIRHEKMHGAISHALLQEIKSCLHREQQVLLFLNRRGYAPVMLCDQCDRIATCPRCDAYMTFHKTKRQLRCHHCDHRELSPPICAHCPDSPLVAIGHGTERIEETLAELIPDAHSLRIDSDSTRPKKAAQQMFDEIKAGTANILIGTQMLVKGHHFPKIALVGIINTDAGLFSADYRASERMAQMLVQISGRAGRDHDGDTVSKVIVQTRFPEHPLLNELARYDYRQFAKRVLTERQEAQLPPFSFQALIRAEANRKDKAREFLNHAHQTLQAADDPALDLYGPVPAPMGKRAGRYRFQLLLQAVLRRTLKHHLATWIATLADSPATRQVRWSVDVDPQSML